MNDGGFSRCDGAPRLRPELRVLWTTPLVSLGDLVRPGRASESPDEIRRLLRASPDLLAGALEPEPVAVLVEHRAVVVGLLDTAALVLP